jgi:hypothetical protein
MSFAAIKTKIKKIKNQFCAVAFELAKSHLNSIRKISIIKHFNSKHDFAAKKLICSIFKLLFWRLDFLLFLFLYQDKKRKIKSARKLVI